MRIIVLIIGLVLLSLDCAAAQYYAAPTGSSNNTGTITSPWDIHTVLFNTKPDDSHPIAPGDTVWLRGGQYTGLTQDANEPLAFSTVKLVGGVNLNGTSNAPIIIRAAPFEAPSLNGRFTLQCDYVWFWGLEVTLTDVPPPVTMTRTDQDIAIGIGTYRKGNVEITLGSSLKLINCVIHDNYGSLGFSTGATDGEMYGNLILNNGRHSIDNSSGHGVYTQNATGTKSITENIFANNFLSGMNLYSGGDTLMNNIRCTNNIVFGNGYGFPPGSSYGAAAGMGITNAGVVGNIMYNQPEPDPNLQVDHVTLGYGTDAAPTDSPVIKNNLFVNGGVSIYRGLQVTMTSNNVYSSTGVILRYVESSYTGAVIDFNNYQSTYANPFVPASGGGVNFATWKSVSSTDTNSTMNSVFPSTNQVFVRPNFYEPGRAHVAIVNWLTNSTISVDLSGIGLVVGQRYIIRAAQDFFGTGIVGTYQGTPVDFPMTGWNVAQPTAHTVALANSTWTAAHPGEVALPSTFPQFGAFVVLPWSPRSINAVNANVGTITLAQ